MEDNEFVAIKRTSVIHHTATAVNNHPGTWSSDTGIYRKNIGRMSGVDDAYKYNNYYSPKLARKTFAGDNASFPKKSPKKEKKWSLGSFFRRRKKGSDSSSEEETEKKITQKKKKSDKRRRPTTNTVGFDHVVLPNRHVTSSSYKMQEDILSEPNYAIVKNFIPASDYTCKFIPLNDSKTFSNCNESPKLDNIGKRKKEVAKRALARRDTLKTEDSSDEDSFRSAFKSDDSSTKPRDGSLSRRSRAARTQRYLKRHSRDEEGSDQPILCKSDIEHDNSNIAQLKIIPNYKPIGSSAPNKAKVDYRSNTVPAQSNFSGLSTIPPSHSGHRYKTGNVNTASFHNTREMNGNNLSKTQSSPEKESDIVHVQLSLGHFNNTNVSRAVNNKQNRPSSNNPPPPPPRDPRRIHNVQNFDARPISYGFENGHALKNRSLQHLQEPECFPENTKMLNANLSHRSTSEDHISWQPLQRMPLIQRPSSVTPDTNYMQNIKSSNPNSYHYITDINPRSRKPICINSANHADNVQVPVLRKPFDFWKQKDKEVNNSNLKKSIPNSPLMFTSETLVRSNIFLPNEVKNESKREPSPFRPITPNLQHKTENISSELKSDINFVKRKSSNLEEALDELEAIYNSLHLGDEDLLERAEQRELAAAQLRRDAALDSFPGSVSGIGRNEEKVPFDSRLKNTNIDRKTDDMAFRKLNKVRYNTINNPQSVSSSVSYLLTSPAFADTIFDGRKDRNKSKEPDITLDDVVYRNIAHTNNTLKIVDPQPPFGIPIGPVLPAANSDYLHATPDTTQKPLKINTIPDIVKDDLAYRNLRKDANKEPSLPILQYIINNNKPKDFKRNRAARSMSANIYSLMQNGRNENLENKYISKAQNIDDIANALEISRHILKEKENKIVATNKAFMSDGELTTYNNFTAEEKLNVLNEINSSHNENCNYKEQLNLPVLDCDWLETKPPTPDRTRRCTKLPIKESTPIPSTILDDSLLDKSVVDDIVALLDFDTDQTNCGDDLIEWDSKKLGAPKTTCIFEANKSENFKSCDKVLENSLDHSLLCEKLLECVLDDQQPPQFSEEVIDIEPNPNGVSNNGMNSNESDLDHDYANIPSPDCMKQNIESIHDFPVKKYTEHILNQSETEVTSADVDEIKPILGGEERVNVHCVALQSEVHVEPNIHFSHGIQKQFKLDTLKSPKLVQNLEKIVNKCKLKSENDLSLGDKACCSVENCISNDLDQKLGNCEQLDSNSNITGIMKQNIHNKNVGTNSEFSHLFVNCDNTVDKNIGQWGTFSALSKTSKHVNFQKMNYPNYVRDDSLNNRQLYLDNTNNPIDKAISWYEDPAVIAFACSCGIACTSQLPSFDLIILLALVCVLISVFIILVIRS